MRYVNEGRVLGGNSGSREIIISGLGKEIVSVSKVLSLV